MSQLADIKDAVNDTPLPHLERGKLFFAILEALGWEIEGVETSDDAEIFLTL